MVPLLTHHVMVIAIYVPGERFASQRDVISSLAADQGLDTIAKRLDEDEDYASEFIAIVRASVSDWLQYILTLITE